MMAGGVRGQPVGERRRQKGGVAGTKKRTLSHRAECLWIQSCKKLIRSPSLVAIAFMCTLSQFAVYAYKSGER